MPYSAGKPFYTSLFTNAAMITALTALMPSINLTRRKNFLQKTKSSQFKLCYIYREYLFQAAELVHPGPIKPLVDIRRIHNSQNILGLILSFYVSFAISARKTAYIMQNVFNIRVSYQTVLNYAESAAYHCHRFNLQFKGPVDDTSAGDETYIKIIGEWAYVFYSYRQRAWYSLPITSRTPAKLCLPLSQ